MDNGIIDKKNKKLFIVLIIGFILLIIAGVFLFKSVSNGKNDKYVKLADENSITRYEWMQMLCEKAGLREYKNNEPYFPDVNESNDYFAELNIDKFNVAAQIL